MCVVNSNKSKYEILVFDLAHHLICCINFLSISTVCRFLDEFDFDFGDVEICKKGTGEFIDPKNLLDIWNKYFVEEFENEIQN